ncbi:MAG: cob(I)yrinic acid a,c-diamide adenosyltransferase [bacterium]
MAIHLYCGNGKGKTTAALGLALRALGQNQKVALIQFMKQGEFGEIKALKKFPNIIIKQFGRPGFVRKNNIIDKEMALAGLAFARNILKKKINVLILDELNTAVSFKLLSEKEVLDFLKKIPPKIEVIITGRGENKKIKAQADLVTEMKEIKHYFQQGLKARKGIEF